MWIVTPLFRGTQSLSLSCETFIRDLMETMFLFMMCDGEVEQGLNLAY